MMFMFSRRRAKGWVQVDSDVLAGMRKIDLTNNEHGLPVLAKKFDYYLEFSVKYEASFLSDAGVEGILRIILDLAFARSQVDT